MTFRDVVETVEGFADEVSPVLEATMDNFQDL